MSLRERTGGSLNRDYAHGLPPPPPCPSVATRRPRARRAMRRRLQRFLAAIARDAQGQGVSRAVIDQAFAGLTPDPAVLASTAASAACSRLLLGRKVPSHSHGGALQMR